MARPPIYVSIILGLIAAGASTYAWFLHDELREARAKSLPPQVQAVVEAAAPADAVAPPAEETEGTSQARRRGSRGTETTAKVAANDAQEPWLDRRGGPGRNSPQVRQLMALQQRAMLDGRYAALFRKLNLGSADLEKLKTLLIERESAAMEVYSTARDQGIDGRENRDQMRELIKGLEAESDAAIRGMLGENNYQQLRQYEQTAPQRSIVTQLEQRLSYSATPFYGNQAEQLVALMAAAAPPNRNNTGNVAILPFAGGPLGPGGRVAIPDSVIAQSTGFLSSAQVQALRDFQQEQQAQQQLLREMQKSRRMPAVALPGSTGP